MKTSSHVSVPSQRPQPRASQGEADGSLQIRHTTLRAFLMAAVIGLSAGDARAADYKKNPFTLTYEGAITKNEPGKVNIDQVKYKLNGLDIAANVYIPPNYDAKKKYPAIVV